MPEFDLLDWVRAKPVRMQIIIGLGDVSFLDPGRDFKTLVMAIALNEKLDSMYVDVSGIQGNLPEMARKGLLKRVRRKTGKKTFFKSGSFREHDEHTNFWRLADAGHTILRTIREGAYDPLP